MSDEMKAKGPKTRKRQSAFDVKAIHALISTCHKSGVSSLKFGDLEVRFYSPSSPRLGEPQSGSTTSSVEPAEMGPTLGLDSVESSLRQPITADPKTLDDFREAQTLLDDPLEFETEMIDRITGSTARGYEGTGNQ